MSVSLSINSLCIFHSLVDDSSTPIRCARRGDVNSFSFVIIVACVSSSLSATHSFRRRAPSRRLRNCLSDEITIAESLSNALFLACSYASAAAAEKPAHSPGRSRFLPYVAKKSMLSNVFFLYFILPFQATSKTILHHHPSRHNCPRFYRAQ